MASREERTAESRTRILDAAVACLVESGYAGATTLRIQARAGVSRGRLLHHFPSREVLLVAASHHLANRRLAAAIERVDDDAALTGTARLDRGVELMWRTFAEPYFWAAVELWTAARTDADLRGVLLPQERELGTAIRAALDRFFGPDLTAHPRYPQVRDLLFTSMRGVGLTYAIDPRDPATDPHLPLWKQTARALLA
ncbi:TetR/AcrR family transcriptional regulator [Pseudonocardia sp.]|uniref:TetR/AcrR family transcriptional regulator n=1 Tax=Pseudonocardia sp. TaxID=60912 RepID=UPI0026017B99|nr:TetR/AcrR family transcriptional regulator [Pseudonocardia sp.]